MMTAAADSVLAIQCRRLSRKLGSIQAVDSLDLNVPTGGVYGFLGPNGAGKTTTIRMMLGLIRVDSGQVELFGQPAGSRKALDRVGALVETPSIYSHLSGRDNLEVTRRLLGVKRSKIDWVLRLVDLTDAADRLAGQYSLGMRQRLGLALALLSDPDLLILDEPTNGLDPAGIREMRELIAELPRRYGVTVFLSSHLLSEIEYVADNIGIISQGCLRFEGTLDELRQKTTGCLELGLDRVEEAAKMLMANGWSVEPGSDGLLQATSKETGSSQQPDQVGAVNSFLVKHGFNVFHLRHRRPSLEHLFLEMTQGEMTQGGRA